MFSYHEYAGQASYHKSGEIRVNEHYYTQEKPAWLIGLRLLGLTAMVSVGYAIALPSLLGVLSTWQANVLIAGVMLVYVGVAFFVRPEPDTDNMGIAGGLGNDPFQYSDNINRSLWNLHCVLGPGRFAAETLLDVCVYLGVAAGEEVVSQSADTAESGDAVTWTQSDEASTRISVADEEPTLLFPSTQMSPDRFTRR